MNIGVILAGGIGSRMGIVDQPKQFIDIYGKPIIIHTLEVFASHPDIDGIAIVVLDEWLEDLQIMLRKFEISKVKWIVQGGSTRQESIYNAIFELSKTLEDDANLIIHDSVRPLISHKIISNNIQAVNKYGAVDTVIPSADTIVRSLDGDKLDSVPKRSELYLGQTPQSFKLSLIRQAHEEAQKKKLVDSTDDCQLVLSMGHDVHLTMGEKLNFKITSFDDLVLLKAIVKQGKTELI